MTTTPGVIDCVWARFARANQSEAAVHLLRRAVAAKPESVDARGALGVVLSSLGRDGEALACDRDALSINPEHPGR